MPRIPRTLASLAALAALAGLAACTSDDAAHDAASEHEHDAASEHEHDGGAIPAIEGDWFACAHTGECDTLLPTGLRFDHEHLVHHLIAPVRDGQATITDGAPYCVTEAFADYEHDGRQLTLTFHQGTLTAVSELAIDATGERSTDGRFRKVHENATAIWHDNHCILESPGGS